YRCRPFIERQRRRQATPSSRRRVCKGKKCQNHTPVPLCEIRVRQNARIRRCAGLTPKKKAREMSPKRRLENPKSIITNRKSFRLRHHPHHNSPIPRQRRRSFIRHFQNKMRRLRLCYLGGNNPTRYQVLRATHLYSLTISSCLGVMKP